MGNRGIRVLVAIVAVLALTVAVLLGLVVHEITQCSVPPTLTVQYWGEGEAKADNTAIVPFKINVSKDIIDDINDRLDLLPPLTPPLEDANFYYGFNSEYLQEVVEYWHKEYKWHEREEFLNKYPQFSTEVAGLNIHFINVKPSKVPEGVQVLPLLLLHGWPSSVREFYDLIPLLTTPRANEKFVFEVVVPSLPGFGFSDGTSKQGLGAAQIAVVFKSLMERLNFRQFYVQGGDWGAIIGSHMAILFPETVLGLHSTMCFSNSYWTVWKETIGFVWPSLLFKEIETSKMKSFGDMFSFFLEESGYMHLQVTKPDTIGIALSDSPTGLAAYILEKFSTWTDPEWRFLPDGGLTKKYSLTDLLDHVMIYWVTDSITTSMRLYSETFNSVHFALGLDSMECSVPTACANFPNTVRLQYQPEILLKDKYINLVQVTDHPRGGHFPAFEEPNLLAEDIWNGVNKIMNLPKPEILY